MTRERIAALRQLRASLPPRPLHAARCATSAGELDAVVEGFDELLDEAERLHIEIASANLSHSLAESAARIERESLEAEVERLRAALWAERGLPDPLLKDRP